MFRNFSLTSLFLLLAVVACDSSSAPITLQASDPTSSGVDLILVDAAADFELRRVRAGDIVDVADVGGDLSLIAVPVADAGVKSAAFLVDGKRSRIENVAPYALAGDVSGDYNAWGLTPGEHSVNVLLFDGPNASGNLILSEDISFTLVDSGGPDPTSSGVELVLIDAEADLDLFTLEDGAEVNSAALSVLLSLRANITAPKSGPISVLFLVNGERFHTENVAPYALSGDFKGDYYAWNLSPGENSVSALVFDGPNATGNFILSADATFTLR